MNTLLNDVIGRIESSLNYTKQQIKTNEQKKAYATIRDHFQYYLKKKVDPEFMQEMIAYHLDQAQNRSVNPKTVLTSDKKFKIENIPIAVQEVKVLTRLSDAVKPTIQSMPTIDELSLEEYQQFRSLHDFNDLSEQY